MQQESQSWDYTKCQGKSSFKLPQRYDSHNAPESFDFLLVPWDGDPTHTLVYMIGED